MITVANSAEYFINEFTQEIYDQVLDHVDLKAWSVVVGPKGVLLRLDVIQDFIKLQLIKFVFESSV